MKKTNIFKMAALTAVFAVAGMFANAQTTVTTDSATTRTYADGSVVKVIDNKGTVKYLQSNNGITTITSTLTGNQTTTTFQLGGTLTDNTYIDVDGNVFAFDGLALATGPASTDATDQSDHGTGTGWTVLVRDEQTGAIKKLLVTDLIQSGHQLFVATDGLVTYTMDPAVVLPAFKTVYVYRNGAKLIAGIDYSIATATGVITLNSTIAGTQYGTVPSGGYETFPIYAGDRIEVHFIK